MKRYFLLWISLLFASDIVIGCSSNDVKTEANEVVDEKNNDTKESASESSSGDDKDPKSLGIELRNHDYDEAEEEIDNFRDYGDGYYAKDGENLTLPEEFPSDFPIAKGMTVEEVAVKESSISVLFNDHGNYTFEQLSELYDSYIHTAEFDHGRFAEESSLHTHLVYIGERDGSEYVIERYEN